MVSMTARDVWDIGGWRKFRRYARQPIQTPGGSSSRLELAQLHTTGPEYFAQNRGDHR